MSEWSQKRSRNRKKLVVFFAVALVFALIYMPKLINKNAATQKPKETQFSVKVNTKGILLLNEKEYKSTKEGFFKPLVDEGEKVSNFTQVAMINVLNDTSSDKQELEQIEWLIKQKQSEDNQNIEEKKALIISKLQSASLSGKVDSSINAVKELRLILDKNSSSHTSELANLSLEQLISKRDTIINSLKINDSVVTTDQSGIVSFINDKTSSSFKMENYESLKPEDIETASFNLNLTPQIVKPDEPIFRIIDNFKYYMAFTIDDAEMPGGFKLYENVKIRIPNHNIFPMTVIRYDRFGTKYVLVLSGTERIDELYKERDYECEIIKNTTEAYSLPKSCVYVKNDVDGVLVKEINGIVQFRPIIILGEQNGEIFIDKGDNKGYIILGDKKYLSISRFDDVFLNPGKVKEGQVLN